MLATLILVSCVVPGDLPVAAPRAYLPIAAPPPKPAAPVWRSDYAGACAERDRTGKPVLILFTDPIGCMPCRKLEAGALADARVRAELMQFVCLRVDVTTTVGRELAATFRRDHWPALLLYRGGHLAGERSGVLDAAELLDLLREHRPIER